MFPIPAAGGIAAPVGTRGCSSVVERHVANVNVVGSNPITRFRKCRQNREIRESDGILHYGLWATKRPL